MEDIARNPDNPDRPDAWMWLFDDEDASVASRDATKKIRQMFFFSFSLILNTQFFFFFYSIRELGCIFFFKLDLSWGSTLVHNHALLRSAILYVPSLC